MANGPLARSLPGVVAGWLRASTIGSWDVAAVVASTGSTNDDAAGLGLPAEWAPGGVLGRVVVADHQASGRGRLGRVWSAPPRTSVAVSVVLRPGVPAAVWGWLPLLAGQAAREAVGTRLAAPAQALVKWPNDVMVRGSAADGKICGLLTEVRGRDVVIGAGINTNLDAGQRPVDTATSLRLVTGEVVDPTALIADYLAALARWWRAWLAVGGDATACGVLQAHRRSSDTIGRIVAVAVPGGDSVCGRAVDVATDGRLVVETGDGRTVRLGAGDVVTVR